MVILDTNIFIDHLRLSEKEESLFNRLVKENPHEIFAISLVTVQELYEGKSTKREKEEMRMLTLLDDCKILPYTYEVASIAGRLARDASFPLEFPDAAIAATALVHDSQLFTLNTKDFEKIPQVKLYKLKGKIK